MIHAFGPDSAVQEIDEMLANSLTAEDEEAVQAELRELQLETVRFAIYLASRHIINSWHSSAYRTQSGRSIYLLCRRRNPSVPSRVRDLLTFAHSPTLTFYPEPGTELQPQQEERVPVAA